MLGICVTNRKGLHITGIAAMILALAGIGLVLASLREPHTIKRRIRYSIAVQNPSDRLLQNQRLEVLAPVKQTSSQTLSNLEVSRAFQLESGSHGNQSIQLELDIMPPFANRTVTVTADLEVKDTASQVDDEEARGNFLRAQELIESDAASIRDVANKIPGTSTREVAHGIFAWVTANIRYARYAPEVRGAAAALARKQGDCTEFAYLATALARARGIPARPVAGFVIEGDRVVGAKDYHSWAELNIDGVWRILDAQKGAFLSQESHYVAMRIGDRSVGREEFLGATNGLSVSLNQ